MKKQDHKWNDKRLHAFSGFIITVLLTILFVLCGRTEEVLAAGSQSAGTAGKSAAVSYPAPENIFVSGVGKMSTTDIYYVNGAKSFTGSAANWNLRYDAKTGTLYMKNYDGSPIEIKNAKGTALRVDLTGQNRIAQNEQYGIGAEDVALDLTSSSKGTLLIEGKFEGNVRSSAIANLYVRTADPKDIRISGSASVKIDLYGKSAMQGIRTQGALSVEDSASLNVSAAFGDKAIGSNFAIYSSALRFNTNGTVNAQVIDKTGFNFYGYATYTDDIEIGPACTYVSLASLSRYPRIDYSGKVEDLRKEGYETLFTKTEYSAQLLLMPENEKKALPVCGGIFPDSTFLDYVENHFDKNHDGWLTDDEVKAAEKIAIMENDAVSLLGTEYLTALKSIEVNGGSLRELILRDNPALTDITVSGNHLKKIDVSKIISLEKLYCQENELEVLSLGKKENLTELFCYGNAKLKKVGLSACPLMLKAVSEGKTANGTAGSYKEYNYDDQFLLRIDGKTEIGTEPIPVQELALNKQSIEIPAGGKEQLVPIFKPEDATETELTYTSSAPKVLAVNHEGVIEGLSVGRSKLTAKTENGKTAEVTVRVLFSDVLNKKLAAYDAVYWGVDKKIIYGYGQKFDVDGICTRGQVVLFLWRAAGKPAPGEKTLTFKDADEIKAMAPDYEKAILWANEKKIALGFTSGPNEGCFKPNAPCTRGQILTFLWRYAGKPEPGKGAKAFKDAAEDHVYYKAIMWASEKKIAGGFSDGTFRPDADCTRGQCATFLYRQLR